MSSVRFKKEWFNPLYFTIKELIKRGVSEFYIYGGKDSAKTVTVSQIIAIDCLLKKRNALVFRKEGSLIKTTVKPSMKVAIETTRISNGWRTMDFSYKSVYGSEIIFKGLDKDEKAKGIEGFSYVLFDELNHFSYEEYDQSILSFRGEGAVAFFGTWNPVSEDSWVKKQLIDLDEWKDSDLKLPSEHSFVKVNTTGNRALIKTIYQDNYWCVGSPCGTYGFVDTKTLQKYERLRLFDQDMYSINVMGNWGVIRSDRPFIRAINYDKMVVDLSDEKYSKLKYSKALPVYISLDFNEKWTATVKQIHGKTKVYYENLHDYPEELIRELALKYGSFEVKITGDSSGRNNNQYTSDASKKTAWLFFKSEFNKYCTQFYKRSLQMQQNAYFDDSFVTTANIGHDASRTMCNALIHLWGETDDIYFDSKGCRDLISDFKRIDATVQGGLDKNDLNRKDIGHWLDTFRYDVCYFHFREFRELGMYEEITEKYKRLDK